MEGRKAIAPALCEFGGGSVLLAGGELFDLLSYALVCVLLAGQWGILLVCY